MSKLNHKEIFDLLVQETNEVDQWSEEDLGYVSKDFVNWLNQDPSAVKRSLTNYYFKRDDNKIDPTEKFFLDWVEDIWVKQEGNKELYQKNPQGFKRIFTRF